MYAIKGRMIAKNNEEPATVYHEVSRAIKVGNADDFPGNLANMTSYTAIGLVEERNIMPSMGGTDKPALFVTLKHTDYDTVVRFLISFPRNCD